MGLKGKRNLLSVKHFHIKLISRFFIVLNAKFSNKMLPTYSFVILSRFLSIVSCSHLFYAIIIFIHQSYCTKRRVYKTMAKVYSRYT